MQTKKRPPRGGAVLCRFDFDSGFVNGIDGAYCHTVLTIGLIIALVARIRIDHVDISFGDRVGGTFRKTEPASRAVVVYFHCHENYLLKFTDLWTFTLFLGANIHK
jgi:hypothetical protein